MSRIVVLFDLPTMTQAQYDEIMTDLRSDGTDYNADRPSHVAFQKGDVWAVVDVWNSEEAFIKFGQERLFGIFTKLGIDLPNPVIYPVHNYLSN